MSRVSILFLALWVASSVGCASSGAEAARPASGVASRGVLVVFHAGPETAQLQRLRDLARTYALEPRAAWTMVSLGQLCALLEAPDRDPSELVGLLSGYPGVSFAQPVQRFRTLAKARFDDPYYDLQHGIRDLPLDRIHARTRGDGVRVALVDTGVDISHPDLAGRVVRASNLAPAAPETFTEDRHGTALAGLIAAQSNNGQGIVGLAPGAELLVFKACWYEAAGGDTAVCDSYSLARALDAALAAEVDLVNLSLTGPRDPLLARLLDAARERSVAVIAAVDESRADGGFPADRPEVLGVRSASPEAPRSQARPGEDHPPWIAGPAVDVLSTAPRGGYDFFSGSSYAAAYVTGVAALLLAQDPDLPADRLVERLRAAAASDAAGPRALDPCRALLPDAETVCGE